MKAHAAKLAAYAIVASACAFLASACSRDAGGAAEAASEPHAATSVAEGACGQAPLPDCPLQSWMKANMAPAMASGDVARLRAPFARVASMALPEYASWRPIAQAGADAVARADVEGVRRACKQCHDENRTRYRADRRPRPVP